MYSLENRRLKRKLEKVLPVEESSEEKAEKRALQRMKLDNSLSLPIRKKLRLNRVVTVQRGRKPDLKMKVEEFVNSDLNSVVVPDENHAFIFESLVREGFG